MADTGRKFTAKEVATFADNGVGEFLAKVTGVKTFADVKFIKTKDGESKLHATYTVEGRTTVKAAVKAMTAKAWGIVVASGAALILANALGHTSVKVLERARGS